MGKDQWGSALVYIVCECIGTWDPGQDVIGCVPTCVWMKIVWVCKGLVCVCVFVPLSRMEAWECLYEESDLYNVCRFIRAVWGGCCTACWTEKNMFHTYTSTQHTSVHNFSVCRRRPRPYFTSDLTPCEVLRNICVNWRGCMYTQAL